ncbi:MATE family efflux transporter [Nocardioides sp. Y6]|uniref:MATE family efflux transporter n=1 Tax=Nocardioides malaquae TaxID=2773426 RepID=A0ABR9RRK1_9ACTN|nr:MATE family efflux transporter [Nocardioides malaquae]MBE7324191.1 MATE family efflux transporter [Nocardioides malaquae]
MQPTSTVDLDSWPVHPTDRQIMKLAVPAFFALVAEPLFLLADTAIVGRLGTTELAGVGIAAVVMQTAVGLCVFLAYGTTAGVARHLGAGDSRRALTLGADGIWLAIGLGVLTTVVLLAATDPLVAAFGVSDAVGGFARDYLVVALLGITPLLVMLAATGVLRGLQDTRTPLWVALGGNAVNVLLNLLLVFGLGPVPALGVAGAALGSVIAQVLSAVALVWVVVRAARREGASLTPDRAGILAAGRASVALVVRTLALRAALVIGAWAVASSGDADGTAVAAHQVAFSVWTFLVFALDAVAIAAQTLTGHALGSGDRQGTRVLTRRMIRWGWGSGVVAGLALAAASPLLGPLFTPDPGVHELLVPILLVAALGQPLAGVVFVLDGVLIGAGDGTYLAWAGIAVLLVYAPAVLAVPHVVDGTGSLLWIWVLFSGLFLGTRCVVLLHRARGDRWMVMGSA